MDKNQAKTISNPTQLLITPSRTRKTSNNANVHDTDTKIIQNENNSSNSLIIRYTSSTLGSGNLADVVRLPYGEDRNEWIAANISDFFRQISMLYGMIAENCTDENCPTMNAGDNYEYFWSDSKGMLIKPCPANVYIDYLLSWVQEELDDENIFPSLIGKPFPANFLHIAHTIMKRLLRIYAHIYHQHFELIEELKSIAHLNTSFKHFMLFVREFNLIDKRQIGPLEELTEKLLPTQNSNNNNGQQQI